MSFFRSPKMWKSQGERFELYGGCCSVSQEYLWSLSLTRLTIWGRALSCKRMIPSDRILGLLTLWRVAPSATLKRTTPLSSSLLAFISKAARQNLHYAHLQSNKVTTVWTYEFSLCVHPTLQMAVSTRNNSVASFCEECVLWRVFGLRLTVPSIYIKNKNSKLDSFLRKR